MKRKPASFRFWKLAGSFSILLSDEEDAQSAGAAVAGDGAACGGLVGILKTAVFGDGGHDGLAHQEDSRKTISFLFSFQQAFFGSLLFVYEIFLE